MARNPFLKVLVTNGIYDMATPYAATEWTFDHLGYEPTYRERVSMTYYEAGHMMYIRPSMLEKFKKDVAEFILRHERFSARYEGAADRTAVAFIPTREVCGARMPYRLFVQETMMKRLRSRLRRDPRGTETRAQKTAGILPG